MKCFCAQILHNIISCLLFFSKFIQLTNIENKHFSLSKISKKLFADFFKIYTERYILIHECFYISYWDTTKKDNNAFLCTISTMYTYLCMCKSRIERISLITRIIDKICREHKNITLLPIITSKNESKEEFIAYFITLRERAGSEISEYEKWGM